MDAKLQTVSDEGWDDADMNDPLHKEIIADMQAFEKKFPSVDLVVENFAEDANEETVKWRVVIDGKERIFDEYHEVTKYLNVR